MNDGILHPIARVEPRPGQRLLVTWTSGEQSIVDFTGTIERGCIWAVLHDEEKFAGARVAFQGRVLEWPEPAGADGAPRIDVDADGLHEMARQQAAGTGHLVSAGPDEHHAA
jgi:hypothetical protein